uniref:Sulfhydryl oxidase n=1 Tax=Scophthalmus maximus TaxID=52904 RepID=A0A8D3B5G7_SCOMX
MFRLWFSAGVVLWLVPGCVGVAARLYTEDDPLVILSGSSLQPAVTNSSSAWLVQFYSSWCGHCIQYSSTWKTLAQDVQDWQRVIRVAVLDCAQEQNFDVCKEFSIKFYPTFKYFRAHAAATDKGTIYRGADRQIQSVRQLMVNILQNHTRLDWPDHCPPLEPYSSVELLPLLGRRSDHFLVIIVEEPDSFVGREVILDLLQFSGVEVRRALTSDLPLLDALKITTFPSVYLLHPNGTHTHLHVEKCLRFFFVSFLRTLPGVQRKTGTEAGSKVYTADLESALHYLLRVELATHNALEGEELKVFKDFVILVAKLYPVGGSVVKLMETLSDWLLSLPLQRIPYQAILDLVDNKMRISGVFLGAELRWVGCQGSRVGLRGYPCSLWTLFHVLTVQHEATPTALENTGLEGESAPVLQVMRRYIGTFFGCEECGRHFGRRRPTVWTLLAGSLSDDPLFPKAPWPSPALCASCHEETNGVHVWNQDNVLRFLRHHYGASNLSPRYSLIPPRLPAPPPNPGPGPGPVQTSWPQEEQRGGGEKKGEEGRPGEQPEVQRGEDRSEVPGLRRGGGAGGRGRAAGRRGAAAAAGGGRGTAGGGVWILGLGFDSVDMSLCVVLYVCSCLFLMLLFFFFKVRSRRWRLRHSRLHV